MTAKQVFVSYLHADARVVDALHTELDAAGHHVWIDRNDIAPGTRWRTEIRNAIRDSLAMIVCLSEKYDERDRSYVNEELTIAIDEVRMRPVNRSWLIPVRLEECRIPDRTIGGGETLADLQAIDLFPDFTTGVGRLSDALNQIASRRAH